MTTFTIRAAGNTHKGLRPSNEDRYAIDADRHILVVVDGMGGGGSGERAADLAVEMLSAGIGAALDEHRPPEPVIQQVFAETNQAVLALSAQAGSGRRGGAAVVLAFRSGGQVYVASLGDSRAYLIRAGRVDQLTVDHTVADAVVRHGTLTEEQARSSPWRNVLYKFLGCAEMTEGAEVRPFTPQDGDRLLLATDGLTNHITHEDLVEGVRRFDNPRDLVEYLVTLALERGSKDNVTCVVAAFDPVRVDTAWLAWNDGLVGKLARGICEEGDFGLLPMLADVLADAGCNDDLILDHCRRPGVHQRACWVLDELGCPCSLKTAVATPLQA
jgi:protein phosphatase